MTDNHSELTPAENPKDRWQNNIVVFSLVIASATVAGAFGAYLWVRSEVDTRVKEQLQLQLAHQLEKDPIRRIIADDRNDARETLKEAAALSTSAQSIVKEVEAQSLAAAQATSAVQALILQLEKDVDASRVLSAIDERTDQAIAGMDDELVRRLTFPTDAVVAFAKARPDGAQANGSADDPCPYGWERYTEADGRMIIGVGPDDIPFHKDGAREYALNIEEMPNHQHKTTPPVLYRNGGEKWWGPWGFSDLMSVEIIEEAKKSGTDNGATPFRADATKGIEDRYPLSEPVGETTPHYNMPPYIALYFCKKLPPVSDEQ